MFANREVEGHREQINEGKHHVAKLVQYYKVDNLDYLTLCDLTRKIFRCFDVDNNQNLDKLETKQLLEAFSAEMNTIGTQFNRKTFQEWFAKIDADGSEEVSLSELTLALS